MHTKFGLIIPYAITYICTFTYIYYQSIWSVVQVNLCQKLLFLQNMGRTCCVQKLFGMSKPISVHNMFFPCSELGICMFWTCNSMNNLSSYCGLVDANIRASDKEFQPEQCYLNNTQPRYKNMRHTSVHFNQSHYT